MEKDLTASKKIEIVIDAAHANRVLAALTQAGAPGHTMVHQATGAGDRGQRDGDGLDLGSSNCCIMIACAPDQAVRLAESVGPLLKRFGGVLLVSDCLWLKH